MPEAPLRLADSEKITINLGHVDLGRIDLLVAEGFYANRADLIRTAIRNQLSAEGEALTRSMRRRTLELGLRDVTRAELEAAQRSGVMVEIGVVGLVRIAADVTPDLALATIASIRVLGSLQGPPPVLAALKSRVA